MIAPDETDTQTRGSDTRNGTDATVTTQVPRPAALQWTASGLTDTGRVRRINEDALLLHPDTTLWLVADGMGGHAKGDLASRRIAERFAALAVPDRLSDCAECIEETLLALNTEFRTLTDGGRDGLIIGSTLVLLLARRTHALFAWVGDSRLYRWRRGRCEQLTQDHSQVEELINEGRLRPEEADAHPAANVVTRAVGADDELFVDWDYRPIQAGDRFLLCSDGLTKEVPTAEIASILGAPADPAVLAETLMERALGRTARDNITVVVAAAQGAEARG